ncbi:MAG: adenylate/guanylate cyclase domain-containing protein [Lachnospiraceae bacterium]|nr:adenylate/guanylate cyclase domain-containing protein [Lachnospiraceae bacterium]
MELAVWLIGNDRKEMIANQRQVNSSGSMRAVCLLSFDAMKKAIKEVVEGSETSFVAFPSLIVMGYEMAAEDNFDCIQSIKDEDSLAGVPLFLAVQERDEKLDEECYGHGAMVVVHRVLLPSEIKRIEHTAWQHENTRRYEEKLQKQASEIRVAKEIMRLNEQLEARNKLLHRVFSRYFSDDVVDLILNQGEDASLGGEKRKATIMMSDLRNFTSLSEKMDSEKVTALLNYYFTKMVDIISTYSGTVIEFLGDGLLAVFGAPIKSEKQTDNAVAAAIGMQNAMVNVNEFCAEKGYPQLEMGIGLHYGEVFVGNIGSEKVMRYNVIGSTVNECSRIESCSVGGQVLASKEIIGNTVAEVFTDSDAVVSAKGLKNPIHIYEITGIGGEYGLSLNSSEDSSAIFYNVDREVKLHLHPLSGKMVSGDFVNARLLKISEKRAVVRVDETELPLNVYSNVEVFPAEKRLSAGTFYSKIVGKREDRLILHFTDAGAESASFVKAVIQLMAESPST